MKIHLVSSTDFVAKGTGVHSAFIGMIDLLKEKNDIVVLKNQEGFGDIFHSHSYGLYYFLKSRKYKGRRVHTVHTTPATIKGSVVFPRLILPFAKLYFKKVFNHADVCIAISPMVEKNLREMGVKSKIIQIGNPIDLAKWKFTEDKRKQGRALLRIPEGQKVVLGVGQLQKRKGVEDFIEIAKNHPDLMPAPASIYAVRFAPDNPDSIYVSGEGGVVHSSNNGQSWQTMLGDKNYRFYFDIAIDPANPQRLFTGGWNKQFDEPQPLIIEWSDNGGATWQQYQYPAAASFFGGVRSMLLVQEQQRLVLYLGLWKGGIMRAVPN